MAVTHQKGTSEFQGAYTFDGALEAIRTPDPFLRREVLYPAELRARMCAFRLGYCITKQMRIKEKPEYSPQKKARLKTEPHAFLSNFL